MVADDADEGLIRGDAIARTGRSQKASLPETLSYSASEGKVVGVWCWHDCR